ncbi:MAG: PhzF family phenazine biosynthesis isomerase [Thermomicrobiales bacterium]
MRLWQVDAFASEAFTGNPAAVCHLEQPADATWMQSVAMEMNLSETAFFWPLGHGGFGLRWFTPASEVPLCGHATLATAHVLWNELEVDRGAPLRFQTLSGELVATASNAGIELDFPAVRLELLRGADVPARLSAAVQVDLAEAYAEPRRYVVELPAEHMVREFHPELGILQKLDRGLVITARSDGKPYDFVSRYFAVPYGVPEDPVTGSAHCSLAPYWQERLGKSEFRAYQASPRGGELGVRIAGERVYLTGRAVTVLRGELAV